MKAKIIAMLLCFGFSTPANVAWAKNVVEERMYIENEVVEQGEDSFIIQTPDATFGAKAIYQDEQGLFIVPGECDELVAKGHSRSAWWCDACGHCNRRARNKCEECGIGRLYDD